MFQLNRRALLRSGLLLSAGNLFLNPRFAVTQALLGATAQTENGGPIHAMSASDLAPREQLLLTSTGVSCRATVATRSRSRPGFHAGGF